MADEARKTLLYGPKGEPLIRERPRLPKSEPGRFDRTAGIARPPQYAQAQVAAARRARKSGRRGLLVPVGLGFIAAFALLALFAFVATHI